MNWLTRLIPSIGSKNDSTSRKSKVPDGLWNNCPACEAILYQPELEKSLFVCPKCDHHLRIGARKRISIFFDGGSFNELATKITTKDVLKLYGILCSATVLYVLERFMDGDRLQG